MSTAHYRFLSSMLCGFLALAPRLGFAEVVKVNIDQRQNVLDGRSFGEAGPYEQLSGTILFAFNPDNPLNARIVDLGFAPRNDRGLVEASANFVVLRPKDPGRSNGVAWLEVSNRGSKASLRYFNRARGRLDPANDNAFGDGLLMRLGLTIIWVGWQWDVPDQGGRLRLNAPIATNNGDPIEGLVRSDWTLDRPVKTLQVGHRNHIAYEVVDPTRAQNVLTVRNGRSAVREIVPRNRWRFARETEQGVVDSRTDIYMESGFEAGKIYELVYVARDPRVVGLGPAVIRDVISYAKYDDDCPFPVESGIAFGVSQTGRFLRLFLYQGFNTDERGRKAFDGMLIHSAGAGRGSFNHRFAQPSRDAHRYSAFFYPTDIYPFTSRAQIDPDTGRSDGLFASTSDPSDLPKVFYTNTGYEYWGRAASLIHTTVDGSADVEPFDHERIYHLASGQHFVVGFPPRNDARIGHANAYRGNPLDFLTTLRALMVRLVDWVADDIDPPASKYPRLSDANLVLIDAVQFPNIPGVTFPTVIHEAYRANYGPRWIQGIIDYQPPKLGKPFTSLVAQVDEFGNEIGGAPTLEIMAPLATYAPWNLRHDAPAAQDELTDFYGTYIPLPLTEAQREQSGDPRPSVEKLYDSRDRYLQVASAAAKQLVREGFLRPEDVDRALRRAEAHWDWLHER